MCLWVLVLPVFIVCYRSAKCIREIRRGSVMCRYLTANDLIYDRMNTLYNTFDSFHGPLGPVIWFNSSQLLIGSSAAD